ncbi:MAG: hypothetical protein NXI31_17500 [bacterium]|nr:hypothetical protein [bacterium]
MIARCSLLSLLAVSTSVLAQSPTLVADIRPGFFDPPSSRVRECVTAGGNVFFEAEDPIAGPGLFCSDGTAAGTRMLRAFFAAEAVIEWLTPVGNEVWFTATDAQVGRELWRSDGTVAGTVLVADLEPGTAGSFPERFFDIGGGRVVFFASAQGFGFEPWVSDGTAAGTALLRDITPGPGGFPPRYAASLGGSQVFFNHNDGSGAELWVTDGTTAGTQRLQPFAGGASDPAWLCEAFVPGIGHRVFFSARATANGFRGIYATAGTQATTQLIVNIGGTGSGPALLTGHDNRLFFVHADGQSGHELWVSDGTAAGTVLAADIEPGTASSFPDQLVSSGNTLYFTAAPPATGRELYSYANGAATLVADLATGFGWSQPREITPFGTNEVAFSARATGVGRELYLASAQNAQLLRDINPSGSALPVVSSMAVLNGNLYFGADDAVSGQELWATDGTTAGTRQVVDLAPGSGTPNSSGPAGIVYDYRGLFFAADDGANGRELWQTDFATTTLVADLASFGGSNPESITRAGQYVYFCANDSVAGRELWRVDAGGAGATMLEVAPGATGSDPTELTAWDGRLAFVADDGSRGRELWVSDGTPAGTVLVRDIGLGGVSSFPNSLAAMGEVLVFSATQNSTGRELMFTDGPNTFVIDVVPGSTGSEVAEIVVLGDRVLFVAETTSAGRELWISDLSVAGTQLVADVNPGPAGSSPSGLVVAGGRVWFVADDGSAGTELWVTDGTTAGTALVMDIEPGAGGAQFGELVPFGDRVLFTAGTIASGNELWVSDGTAAGTQLLVDSVPGSGGALIYSPFVSGSRHAYFFATSSGSVLYRTDGSPAGTVVVPTPGLAAARVAAVHGERIYFVADDGVTGGELWALDVGATSVPLGGPCAAGRGGPELRVDDPVLGTTVTSRCTNIQSGTAAWLLLGLRPFLPLPVTNDCLLLLEPGTAVDAGFALVSSGAAQFSTFVPNSTVLLGLRLANQVAVTVTPHSAGWDLSNAVLTTVGL